MKKQIALVSCLVLVMSFAGLGAAQVGRSGMQGQPAVPGASKVDVKLVDAKGQPIRAESLPKDVQAKVERVRKAAEGLVGGEGGAERLKVTVNCSYPPLNCTITISF